MESEFYDNDIDCDCIETGFELTKKNVYNLK